MIYRFLAEHGIAYTRYDHPPVFTCEEAERLVPPIPAAARTKNVFLRDRKARRHFLVAVGYGKSVDLPALADRLGVSKLSLGSPERLQRYLGVEPGSVTLLAVLNDVDRAVEVVLDGPLWDAPALCCHPLVNTSTLAIPRADLQRFLELTGHPPRRLDVPARRAG